MARKKKQKQALSYQPSLVGEAWLQDWAGRVGYVPPPVIERGQGLRKVAIEGVGTVLTDPTLFTPTGPSKKTAKKRIARNPERW